MSSSSPTAKEMLSTESLKKICHTLVYIVHENIIIDTSTFNQLFTVKTYCALIRVLSCTGLNSEQSLHDHLSMPLPLIVSQYMSTLTPEEMKKN